MPAGIETRHARNCTGAKRCDCKKSYHAVVYLRGGGRRKKVFARLDDARAWRATVLSSGLHYGEGAPKLRDAADALIAGMRNANVRTRSGTPYKPSVIRGYERSLIDRINPTLGALKLDDIRRRDVQRLVDDWTALGLEPATVRNLLMPLRVIYRRAIQDELVTQNPTTTIRLAAVTTRRERIASVTEADALIHATRKDHRAIWATAFYAGLRLGELQALRWSDVDLASGLIHVRQSWDARSRTYQTPKSEAGTRSVPIIGALRDILLSHATSPGLDAPNARSLIFGGQHPFTDTNVRDRARSRWKAAGLAQIGFHESRHTYASILIAAGVNAKTISTYMGHSSIGITFDRYGHLMPGSEAEAVALVDAYLERADTAARIAQLPT